MVSQSKIVPVILCGGGGTRLWPRSRPPRPKPFLPLIGERTLFRQTIDRCSDPELFSAPVIVAGGAHIALIEEQLSDDQDATIIAEPSARNTAPAIALAAASLPADAIMLVCPSDHYIADEASFRAAATQGARLAGQGYLTAFGIEPTKPHTGYGYIESGEPLDENCARIARFVEKPDLATAKQFLEAGGYYWNGGIFCFRAGQLLEELARFRPDMTKAVRQAVAGARQEDGIVYPDGEPFAAIEGESIDYALMENTKSAAMVPVSMGWSDIGDWAAVAAQPAAQESPADMIDSTGVTVLSDGPNVSVVGCEDIVVVVDGDEILVVSKDHAQAVGKLPGIKGRGQ